MSPYTTPNANKARDQLLDDLCSDIIDLREVPEAPGGDGTSYPGERSMQGANLEHIMARKALQNRPWHISGRLRMLGGDLRNALAEVIHLGSGIT